MVQLHGPWCKPVLSSDEARACIIRPHYKGHNKKGHHILIISHQRLGIDPFFPQWTHLHACHEDLHGRKLYAFPFLLPFPFYMHVKIFNVHALCMWRKACSLTRLYVHFSNKLSVLSQAIWNFPSWVSQQCWSGPRHI